MLIVLSQHALQRYQERVEDLPESEILQVINRSMAQPKFILRRPNTLYWGLVDSQNALFVAISSPEHPQEILTIGRWWHFDVARRHCQKRQAAIRQKNAKKNRSTP